jgi:hypothetical protein
MIIRGKLEGHQLQLVLLQIPLILILKKEDHWHQHSRILISNLLKEIKKKGKVRQEGSKKNNNNNSNNNCRSIRLINIKQIIIILLVIF